MDDKNRKETFEKWQTSEPLYKKFPIKFESGASFTELTGKCNCCDNDIPKENMRGEIINQLSNVYSVDALGLCLKCNLITPYFYRLRGDNGELTLEWKDENGWQLKTCQKSFIDKIFNWLK